MTALVALIGQPGWAETIQFFSFVSIVPLGLLLLRKNYAAANFEAIAWLAAPSAAAFAGIGYLFTPGPLAALWATPWLLVTAVVAAGGILRAIDRPWPIDHHLLSAAAEVFLLVGGFWFWFSRAGMNPGGFSDQIVTLTGIHFHYAGFAMPLALAQIGTAKPNRNVNIAAIGILIGIPATALGITIGGWAELIGGTFMAAVGVFVAVLLYKHARTRRTGPAIGLGFASVCLAIGMILAASYVINLHVGPGYLTIERMVRTHGSINGFGFALVALVSFAFEAITTDPKKTLPKRLGAWGDQNPSAPPTTSPLSYPAGLVKTAQPSSSYRRDKWARVIGQGPATFELAQEGLRNWVGHKSGAGFTLTPHTPCLEAGTRLAVYIPVGPLTFHGPTQIVEVTNKPNAFGFTYGTLYGHFSQGEESFIVSIDEDGSVRVDITAVWKPAWWLLTLGGPITRMFQRQAIRRWLDGLERYCQTSSYQTPLYRRDKGWLSSEPVT